MDADAHRPRWMSQLSGSHWESRGLAGMPSVSLPRLARHSLSPIPSDTVAPILRVLSEIPDCPGGSPLKVMGACDTHSQPPDAVMVCMAC